jgi:hypothetical protein
MFGPDTNFANHCSRTLSDFIFDHILKCSNPLWLALSQALAFAYFPGTEVLHVKCRLLPEDLVTQPTIGVIFEVYSLTGTRGGVKLDSLLRSIGEI